MCYLAFKMKNIIIFNSMDEPGGHTDKWNKPAIKSQMLYDFSPYMECLELSILEIEMENRM